MAVAYPTGSRHFATQSFHRIFKTLDRAIPRGLTAILGEDDNGFQADFFAK